MENNSSGGGRRGGRWTRTFTCLGCICMGKSSSDCSQVKKLPKRCYYYNTIEFEFEALSLQWG